VMWGTDDGSVFGVSTEDIAVFLCLAVSLF
jgi:hypothetical protein